jgi:hypothetical protein
MQFPTMRVFLILIFLCFIGFVSHGQNDLKLISSDELILDLKTKGKESPYYKKHYLSILLYLDEKSYAFIDSIRPENTFMNQYQLGIATYDFKLFDTEETSIRKVLTSHKRFKNTRQAFVNGNKSCTYSQKQGTHGFSSELTCHQLERGMLLLKSSISVIE